ncbi:microtubule associated protein Ase1 [Zymoseptoria brevis]|uniref:Microtubule associated protein Ase1 n=1 Tax=Zymoseptoria brevis TaxID=1047168 RepID=A0A0F4GSW5_9PEZI|nr:microtubule associated protein Ase1 [Zymoseptoria brevis]
MDTSYLSQQVTTIVERLHGFFDEIGVPSHERDSRESELFSALSETLHNQLNLVAKEKHDLTEEAQRLIKTIRQMERSLDDSRPKDDYEAEKDGLKVTFPLMHCIKRLKEKHHTIAKLHRERYEQVKKLVEALQSYASHLEPSFVKIKLPPTSANGEVPSTFDLSPTYVTKLDNEFTRIYDEYNKRVAAVSQYAEAIISLWSELGTPQAQVDSQIVQFARDSPEQLGLHQDDMKRLAAKHDKLIAEKQQREKKLKELRTTVDGLWDRLGVDESERKQFLAANRGCGVRQINEFEDELSRLNELKRQNLHIFVEDARFKLQELWDGLYFSEEEMLDFTPAFSDVYSDALLSAHENEIARLEALAAQRAPIIAAVDKHRSLIKDREDLEKSSHDASRLMQKGQKGEKRDPGKLLREEKMRKRIAKDLPKVEAELRQTLESWEDEYGRPFCVHGQRYIDELDAAQAKAPPPRSKTPNAMGSTSAPRPKSAVRGAVQPQSQPRAQTMRGGNPTRSKTPTGNRSLVSHSSMSQLSQSVMGQSTRSPSKIPGSSTRLPMSALKDGNNSPERRTNHPKLAASHDDLQRTLRGGQMAPPPPKMKDLFLPPTPTRSNSVKTNNSLDLDRPASVLRHIAPEDPYEDPRYRTNGGFASSMSSHSHASNPRTTASSFSSHSSSRPMSRSGYPTAPAYSRQTSNTSSIMSGSAAAGSENWETYTDNSDVDEADADHAYYTKQQAQQSVMRVGQGGPQKRPGTASGGLGMVKRVREQAIVEEGQGNGRYVVDGSEANWTDDGEVGETF